MKIYKGVEINKSPNNLGKYYVYKKYNGYVYPDGHIKNCAYEEEDETYSAYYNSLRDCKRAINNIETRQKTFYKVVVGGNLRSSGVGADDSIQYYRNQYVSCPKGGYLAVFNTLDKAKDYVEQSSLHDIYTCRCLGLTTICADRYCYNFLEVCKNYRNNKKYKADVSDIAPFAPATYVEQVKLFEKVEV